MDGKYVPRHGCKNLTGNKIIKEDIYNDKNALKAKLNKTLCSSFFNIIVFPRFYTQVWRGLPEGYGKMYTYNIVAWAHSKRGNSGADWVKDVITK